jgi:hypothetical protein
VTEPSVDSVPSTRCSRRSVGGRTKPLVRATETFVRSATASGSLPASLAQSLEPLGQRHETTRETLAASCNRSKTSGLSPESPDRKRSDPVFRSNHLAEKGTRSPLHRNRPAFRRKRLSIHRKRPSIHRNRPSVHRNHPSIHRERLSFHRNRPSIHRNHSSVRSRHPASHPSNPALSGRDPSTYRLLISI